jgi:AraC-like DNA-binding protein
MSGTREKIDLPPGHSFRFVRWHGDWRNIEVVISPFETAPIRQDSQHWHFHPEMELIFFDSGEGTRYVGDHIGSFKGMDLVMIGENVPHFWELKGRSSGCSIQWGFPQHHPLWNLAETASLRTFFSEARRGIHFGGRTAETNGRLLRELQDYQGLERLGLFFQLLHRLSKSPRSDRELLSRRTISLPAESQYEVAMQDAMRYLVSNFAEEIHLPDLLLKLGMTKPTFSRQFRKYCGKTFTEFLQQVRLEAVCRQLRDTDTPVVKIAFSSGFTQLSFFNRLFRRYYQCSPLAFRRKHQTRAAKSDALAPFYSSLSGGAGLS